MCKHVGLCDVTKTVNLKQVFEALSAYVNSLDLRVNDTFIKLVFHMGP